MRQTEDSQLLPEGEPVVVAHNAGEAGSATTPPEENEKTTTSAAAQSLGPIESHDGVRRRHGTFGFVLLWKLELMSMVTSVAALMAIIAVLFAFDGKSMADWNAIARPNTVVSVLSTLAKSSMMMVVGQGLGQLKWQHFEQRPRRLMDFEIFESASRGPWGSLELLYHINWRALSGSTGAIITILALAMDPFAQQVISFDSRTVSANNMTSVITAARTYDMNSRWETSTDASVSSYYNKVRDTSIVGAVYQGMFGTHSPMPFSCPSGDCTWEPFESIGICNTCVDVTAVTNTTRVCQDGDFALWNDTLVLNRTCQYETPSGYRVNGNAMNANFNRDSEQHHTLWNSTTHWDRSSRGEGETQPNMGIATIAVLKFDEYDDISIASPEVWLESAYECTLSWCAQEFNTTHSQNGQLTDEPTRSTPLVLMNQAPCRHEDGEQSYDNPMIAFSSTGDIYTSFVIPAYKRKDLPLPDCPNAKNGVLFQEYESDPKAFWLNAQDDINLQAALGSMFTITWESVSRPGDDPARALYRAKNFSDTMDQLARSMSNQIRIGPNQTDISGSVEISEQYIHVRWPWMILPAALVLLSVVFLVFSMILATRECRGWKSSVLPSFYHGLSGWDESELRSDDIQHMQSSARLMWAKLGTNEDGAMKLVRAKT